MFVEAGDEDVVPQWVKVGAALVKDLREVGVKVLCVEGMRRGGTIVFLDVELVENAVDVLHVGDVAAEAHHSSFIKGSEALDISEAGERAI